MIQLLFVDTNPDRCATIAASCERVTSVLVKTLHSADATLEWLSSSSADVIVSGHDLPGGMDGIALLRELRARGNTTPFILFPANMSPRIREEAYRNGAFSVLSSTPWGKNSIYRLIRTVYWAALYEGD